MKRLHLILMSCFLTLFVSSTIPAQSRPVSSPLVSGTTPYYQDFNYHNFYELDGQFVSQFAYINNTSLNSPYYSDQYSFVNNEQWRVDSNNNGNLTWIETGVTDGVFCNNCTSTYGSNGYYNGCFYAQQATYNVNDYREWTCGQSHPSNGYHYSAISGQTRNPQFVDIYFDAKQIGSVISNFSTGIYDQVGTEVNSQTHGQFCCFGGMIGDVWMQTFSTGASNWVFWPSFYQDFAPQSKTNDLGQNVTPQYYSSDSQHHPQVFFADHRGS